LVFTHSHCVARCSASTKVEIINHSNRHSLGSSIMGNPFQTPTRSRHLFEEHSYDCTSQTRSSHLPTQYNLIACLMISPRASQARVLADLSMERNSDAMSYVTMPYRVITAPRNHRLHSIYIEMLTLCLLFLGLGIPADLSSSSSS
jgi:hypothetical protein